MRNRKIAGPIAAAALLALPAATASAHVTLQPNEVPAGEFKRLDIRVPNERDDAGTKKVEVQFPDGFYFASYEPVPGWKGSVVKEKLATPVDDHGEKITEQVDRVILTAESGEEIEPGQFRDFGLSVGLPEKPQTLTFKAVQTYDSGEVVRWIGEPDADEPAPQVKLTAATDGEAAAAEAGAAPAAASDDGGDDDDGNGLAIVALIVGALGLATAAFAVFRRPRSAA